MNLVSFINAFIFLLISGNVVSQEIEITSVAFPSSHTPSTIGRMTQDHNGNIWMIDISLGLYKYDGENFTHFTNERDNPNSLISDRLETIFTDREGIIWIGSFANGLVRLDPVSETFTTFQHDEKDPFSIRSNNIRSIAQDQDGDLWIGTLQGLDHMDLNTNQFSHTLDKSPEAEILGQEHIRVLYVDREGTLWVGGSSPFYGEESQGGLFSVEVRSKEVKRFVHTADKSSLNNNVITALYEDSKGNFWVGTAGDGLHIMDRAKGTFTRYTHDANHPERLSRPPLVNYNYVPDHIRFISEDAEGQIWIGTFGNGANRFDPEIGIVQHYGTKETGIRNISVDNLWSCLTTSDDLFWISAWGPTSQEEILMKVNLSPHKVFEKVTEQLVYCFEEGEDGSIYLGARNELIEVDKDGKETILYQFDLSFLNDINHLNKDKDGNLWISSMAGLQYYNVVTKSMEFYFEDGGGMNSPETFVSAFINQDSLLFGSNTGVHLFDLKQKKIRRLEHSDTQIRDQQLNRVETIFIDSRKNIWVSFRNFGLKRLDLKTEQFIDYTFIDKVQDRTLDFYEDKGGNLYIGNFVSGLRKYDPNQDNFYELADKTGILSDELGVLGISAEEDSILWIIKERGIVKYDLRSNNASLFGLSWGYHGVRVGTFGLFKSSLGDYYVGTRRGYYKFRPEVFERRIASTAKPFISDLTVDDESISVSNLDVNEKIKFNYDQNNVSLKLGYIDFRARPEGKNLQYRLDNYDTNWRIGRNTEEIYYYKLPPGFYTFRYKAMDLYGEWLEESLTFEIAPPWWRTWWVYLGYAALLVLAGWRFHLYQQQRTIRRERERTREIELAHAKEIEKAYTDLKNTQDQLVHAEKMASLGELTAGIAHEIQNPLNFVNNFSDVSNELIDEMREEFEGGDYAEGLAIAADIKQNLEKITHHGRRADSIVKGMLQHSRTTNGERLPTDINALAEEYLRIAYHGLRARDTSFNVKMETDFDEAIGKVEVNAQDIGRVILNLITNAFQACTEGGIVRVSTKKLNDKIEISVSDNGSGIPKEIKDKIFQPFFTTKPTGQGTGLGLSLAYDIVKAHGGELQVVSDKKIGSHFIVNLPLDEKA